MENLERPESASAKVSGHGEHQLSLRDVVLREISWQAGPGALLARAHPTDPSQGKKGHTIGESQI